MRHCRLFISLVVLTALGAAQTTDISPRIGDIEVFGSRRISQRRILNAVGAKIGDPLPPSEATEDRVNKLVGVLVSRLEAVCCTTGHKIILYVGVEERDAPHIEFHPRPTDDITLPNSLYQRYVELLEEVEGSIRGKNADEDLTNGYSLMADPYARVLQRDFVTAMTENLNVAAKVVRESADPEQRAAAAYLLQYAPRGPRTSKVISDALQYALRDQEDVVRKNALQALHAVLVGAKLHPEQEISVEPTWFVELLNSVVFSDRRLAAEELVNLTEDRTQSTLDLLRERALPAVLEMARWHNLEHALPAFILAGRMAGLDEAEIKKAWGDEDRESVLEELQSGRRHKKK